MAITHTINSQFVSSNGGSVNGSVASTGDSENNYQMTIASSANNEAHDVMFPTGAGQLKSIYLLATARMTIKTNSSGSPTNTIELYANEPIIWTSNGGAAQPFSNSVDVTKFYVTSTPGGTLECRILTASV
jgi:hypothetical protein